MIHYFCTDIASKIIACKFHLRTIKSFSKLNYKMTQNYSNIIFKSVDSVLDHLNKEQFKQLDAIHSLLNVYKKEVIQAIPEEGDKKYPLIVIEGLDGCGKSTATKRVSATLNAILFNTPPPCLKDLRPEFDSPPYKQVRTAFYALGNYIAAFQIKQMLKIKPVILDRFWHSTIAYALAQTISDNPDDFSLPPEGDPIYNWPDDLLLPEVVIFLWVNEKVRLKRLSRRLEFTQQEQLLKTEKEFRSNVDTVYNRITPKIQYLNGSVSKLQTERDIIDIVMNFMPKSK